MYKLEMHLHTLGKSPCATTDEKTIAELYESNGYDGIICTNHYISELFRSYYQKSSDRDNALYYVDGYYTLKAECEKRHIDVFLGMELCIDSLTYYKPYPPHAELLIYGITPEYIIENPTDLFKMSLEEVSSFCKSQGWILGQSHPYRSASVVPLDPKFLEAVEAYNGHHSHVNQNEKAMKMAEDNGLLKTAGSDFHHIDGVDAGVYLKNAVKTNEELVEELRRRRHIIFHT